MRKQLTNLILQALLAKYKDIDIAVRIYLEQIEFFNKKKRQEEEEDKKKEEEKKSEAEKQITRTPHAINVDQLGHAAHYSDRGSQTLVGSVMATSGPTAAAAAISAGAAAPHRSQASRISGEKRARGGGKATGRGRGRSVSKR